VTEDRYRLVTRSDFDGLVCAVLLKQLDLVGDIVFVHPKDVQDGQVEIGPGNITADAAREVEELVGHLNATDESHA
jgi:hypothetical protein